MLGIYLVVFRDHGCVFCHLCVISQTFEAVRGCGKYLCVVISELG